MAPSSPQAGAIQVQKQDVTREKLLWEATVIEPSYVFLSLGKTELRAIGIIAVVPFSLLFILYLLDFLLLLFHLLLLFVKDARKNKQVESRINLRCEGLLKLKGGLPVSGQVSQCRDSCAPMRRGDLGKRNPLVGEGRFWWGLCLRSLRNRFGVQGLSFGILKACCRVGTCCWKLPGRLRAPALM